MILWKNENNINEVLETVQKTDRSVFYKNKFSKNKDLLLEKLPFLSRKELVDVLPDERLYVEKKDVVFVGYTSGTTSGKPLISFFSQVDNYFFEPSLGTGITRPLITYPPLNKNFGYSFVQQCAQAKNKVTPIFGDYQNLANSAFLAKETNVDAIYATPTIAINLGEKLSEFYNPEKILLLALSSETLTSTQRKKLSKLYPKAKIANLYASSEVGQFIMYPCKKIIDSGIEEFHFLQNAISALEIIDGELVVTYTLNKAFPLIRYKTGDFFEVANKKCGCGSGLTLKWSGRSGVDRIRVNGFEITVGEIEESFTSAVPIIGSNYQVHFYNNDAGSDTVQIIIEVKKDKKSNMQNSTSVALAQKILLNEWYLTSQMTMSGAVKKGIFETPEIIFVDDFSYKSEKTRKIVSHIS